MNNQKTVLIIDDEVDLQQLLKIVLKTKGYQVEIAGNGLEGLAKLKTLRPDLIILDMNMPKMGGVEFYQNICDELSQPLYPILVLTARANMEKLFKEFNIDGFMAKPFEVDELLAEVDLIINKRSSAGKQKRISESNQPPKVCIVEDNEYTFNKIGPAFLSAGYVVNPARSGVEAIERISATVPDVVIVKLGLPDISGDIVILRLKRMSKTQHIKYVLYTEHSPELNAVAEKIGNKLGIDCFIEYQTVQDLVFAAENLLKYNRRTGDK